MKAKRFVSIICALIILIGCCSVLLACQPRHTCQNVCQDCGKCLNVDCTEEACVDKCLGHTPPHSCTSICDTCKLCTNADCTEEACANKCLGHHVCDSVCAKCGKCTNTECTLEPCIFMRCKGHDFCQNPCPKCGGCTGQKCNCPKENISCNCGYPWYYTHLCTNVCQICGMCTNTQCTQEPCILAKCPGHNSTPQISLLDEPVTEYNYIPLTSQEEAMLKQAFVDYRVSFGSEKGDIEPVTIEAYYGKIDDIYILEMRSKWETGYIEYDLYYNIDGLVMSGSHRYQIFVYKQGEFMQIDDAYENKLLSYDQLVIVTHYMCAYDIMQKMIKDGQQVNYPIKINPVARVGGRFFYYVGEDISTYNTLTRSTVNMLNVAFDNVPMEYWFEESNIYYAYGKKSDFIQYTWEFLEIQNHINYYLQQKSIIEE